VLSGVEQLCHIIVTVVLTHYSDKQVRKPPYNQQSAISNQQSAISNQQSAISNQQSAISNQQHIPSNSISR